MSINNPNTPADDQNLTAGLAGALPGEASERLENDLTAAESAVRRDLNDIKQLAAQDVRNLTEEAKSQLGTAGEKAKSFATDQKDFAAGQLSGVASAITKVADELDGGDQTTIARYARDMAQGMERLSGTVRDRDVNDLMSMAQNFGRSQPVAFLGAAALLGFMASRMVVSSGHRQSESATPQDMGGDQSGPYRGEGAGQSHGSSSSMAQNMGDLENGRH